MIFSRKHPSVTASLGLASLLMGLMAPSVDTVRAEEAPRPYPLKTCVVSDEKLGSMGKSYVHKHEGREVQFCCKSCLKDFNKDPKKFLKKLDDASPKSAEALVK